MSSKSKITKEILIRVVMLRMGVHSHIDCRHTQLHVYANTYDNENPQMLTTNQPCVQFTARANRKRRGKVYSRVVVGDEKGMAIKRFSTRDIPKILNDLVLFG
jgi:hypothetical protein